MDKPTSIQTEQLVETFARRMQGQRAELVNRYRRSLQETVFTNRAEFHPRELGQIAGQEADALIGMLAHPELGTEQGAKMCQMGLSAQTALALGRETRKFTLAVFDRDLIPQALDVVDAYENAVIRGFMQSREKLILAEQERIRGALQIAVGRFTVEIKDIQEMAQRVMEANEFKTRFIARVSHELRTPLGALLGMTEMLQQNVYGPLTLAQMDITERIINNTRTLERVFAELLDQSQLESGLLRLRQSEFSPKVLAHTVRENYLPLALKKGLSLQLEVDPQLPNSLLGDKERIEQILSNLVVNAIKYTQSGGIEIHVRLDGSERWMMQVQDTGIGISEQDLPLIFQPFRQADESTGRKFGGVGLGLAIVQQLVMAMDGTVNVSSKIGQGSTFSVVLPLRPKREST
ncbi:MAG TPA: ATP-binding protein [Anaerolineales bacterium]|nr:ATP-binding protein [Anaerolineales bacterium]